MARVRIRPARIDEAALLTRLCVLSKKFWGYDRIFMARSRPALTVEPGQIAAGDVWVAEDGEGAILGVGALSVHEAPDALEVDKLFVAPERIRSGVGRVLMARLSEEARTRGARRLMILSDPNAAAFYERMGARCVGAAPSDAIPGRTLPLYELVL
jgi:N-acetylglutamate synthase-like GNAT family acetyltransferase